MMNYRVFLTSCVVCHSQTSKSYARQHSGKCKSCETGVATVRAHEKGYKCPDCGQYTLSAYQKAHHYHCDRCTRAADPIGWANEVRGFYD